MRAFVIAMPCEAEAIRAAVRAEDRLYVSGIGKVNAAAATQKAIDAGATEIVNCGLCGGFDAGMRCGDVYEVTSAVEYDFDLALLDGTRVGQKSERNSPYIPVRNRPGDLPGGCLATGDHFNDSDADVALLRNLGCTLRDMEGAAIADVCDKNGVPCRLFKCVSDVHGCGSMTGQYRACKATCLRRLGESVCRVLA